MAKQEHKQRGIFCLETIWYDAEDQTSIRPMLEMMRDCYLRVPFIHRSAVTLDAFKYHVAEWLSLDRTEYPILYLGYHGEPNVLKLRPPRVEGGLVSDDLKDTQLNLLEIVDILDGLGDCKNRIIHFASCSTLKNISDDELGMFVSAIGASAVSGYDEVINWVESTAFELSYLNSLQYGGGKNLTPNVMQMVRSGSGKHWPLLGEDSGSPFVAISKQLGFRLQVLE